MLGSLELQLCDIQGRLFEISLKKGFASERFIDQFMRSKCAAEFDMSYNRLQWMGEEYIMEELICECGDRLIQGDRYSEDALFWIGYTYRYWHFLTGESSNKISSQVPAHIMGWGYPGFHTEDMALAIEDLKQTAKERRSRKSKRTGPEKTVKRGRPSDM
jgi:hypothetical protein